MPGERVSLEVLKLSEPKDVQEVENFFVKIWSGEHRAYWRPDGKGYTTDPHFAGLYPLKNALERSRHAGPEKKISYELAHTEYGR